MGAPTVHHTTLPDGLTPRCPGPFGKGHATTPWDRVIDAQDPGRVTCADCIEGIRNAPRPRWLDERLFADEQPSST